MPRQIIKKPQIIKKSIVFPLLLVAFSPLGIDLFLPGMSYVNDHYGVGPSVSQWTISAFTLALGLTQIPFGIYSDIYGRRKTSLIGLSIFILGSMIAIVFDNIEMLIIARLIQGVGTGAMVVVAFTMIRDQYDGEEAAIKYSYMGVVLNILPSIAPTIGALILIHLSFAYNFIFYALLAVIAFIFVAKFMRETRPSDTIQSKSVMDAMAVQLSVLSEKQSWPGALVSIINLCFIISYVSLAPIVLMEQAGLSEQNFAILFGANAIILALASYTVSLVNKRVGSKKSVNIGLGFSILGMGLLCSFGMNGDVSIADFAIGIVLSSIGFAFSIGNGSAAALEHHGARAGIASGTLGALQMIIASILAAIIISLDQGTTDVFSIFYVIMFCVVGLYWLKTEGRAQSGVEKT